MSPVAQPGPRMGQGVLTFIAHQAVAGAPVGTGVGRGRGGERAFGKLLVGGGLARDLVDHGGEPAVAVRAEGHALLRLGTEANSGGELTPRQLQPHRAAGAARGHRGERDMRPRPQRRAEGAADERVDDPHLLRIDAEAARDLVPLVADPLRLAPQRQPVALPLRHGRVRLHRVVLLARLK